MNFAFLDKIREQEVAVAGPKFREPPGRLLEIGAGTGAQAVVLAARGFQVSAIEIAGSIYENEQVFPVAIYDGSAIPFPDASFDIVFSSHVLVHIVKHDDFQKEILRVLKPGGRVVHILPTTSWRFWTCLVHYPISYIRHGARILNRLTGDSTQPAFKTAQVNASGPYNNTAEISASDRPDPNSVPNDNNPLENDQKTVIVTPSALSSLTGKVYADVNNNGLDDAEPGISGATVTLTGKDANGATVNLSVLTQADGSYSFTGLIASNAGGYTITETQPSKFLDKAANNGTPAGLVATPSQITGIPVTAGSNEARRT